MFKYLLGLLAVGLFIGCGGAHQTGKGESSVNKFTFNIDEGSRFIDKGYHYSLELTPSGSSIYKQYYPPTGVMTDYITYKSRKQITKHGKMIKWFDDGSKYQEGYYKNGLPDGEWKYYNYGQKVPYTSGQYIAGKKEGVWRDLDTLGNVRLIYTYQANVQKGPYQMFNPEGELIEEGRYQYGKRISKKDYRKEEERAKTTVEEKMPFIASCKNDDPEIQNQCSSQALLTAIYRNIRYPGFARENGIQGTALIRFTITKTGEVKNPIVLRGLYSEIAAECLRVMDFIPEWQPATENGEPVETDYNVPIKFRIE